MEARHPEERKKHKTKDNTHMKDNTDTTPHGGGESTALAVLENPQGSMEKAQELCRYVKARRDEVLAQIAAADAAIDETNFDSKEATAEVKRLAEIVEDLRERGKELVKDVCAATEAQRVLTAIDSRLWSYSTKADPDCAYAKLSAALKALKAKVAAFKEANRPKEPVRAVAVVLYATDKGVADLCAKIKGGKLAGVEGYQFAPDEAAEKKAVKIICATPAAK